MASELKGKGLSVVTVNGSDSAAVIAKFFKEQKITLPALMDKGTVASKYGVQAIPTNYVIDSSGKVLGAFEGFDENGIRQALAKSGNQVTGLHKHQVTRSVVWRKKVKSRRYAGR